MGLFLLGIESRRNKNGRCGPQFGNPSCAYSDFPCCNSETVAIWTASAAPALASTDWASVKSVTASPQRCRHKAPQCRSFSYVRDLQHVYDDDECNRFKHDDDCGDFHIILSLFSLYRWYESRGNTASADTSYEAPKDDPTSGIRLPHFVGT